MSSRYNTCKQTTPARLVNASFTNNFHKYTAMHTCAHYAVFLCISDTFSAD